MCIYPLPLAKFFKDYVTDKLLSGKIGLVKESLAVKYFGDISLVDSIISLDEQVRKLKVESEALQATMNAASKEIGMLMGKGEKEKAEAEKTGSGST